MRCVYCMLILLLAVVARAESVRHITLEEAVAIARTKSVDAAVALNELRTAQWEYRTFRAGLLPEVTFKAKLPGYYRQYSSYQNSDGSYSFVPNNYMEINGELSLTQSIWFTGGTLSLNTSLDYLRQFGDNASQRFMSLPVALTLNQPIFGVNAVKWNRRIEPVRYQEAMATYMSASETVAMTAISYFFNLLIAGEDVASSEQNLDNAERLYGVAQAKREMGQISRNDLLQMELNLLDARSALTDARSAMSNRMFQLRSFLGIGDSVALRPVAPRETPVADVTYGDVLDKALERNAFSRNVRRRQLEAEYEVVKARGEMQEISLFAQIGYTGMGARLNDAYGRLRDNQVVEVGVKIPLLDWGKRRGRVKVAESNREVVESRLRREEQSFREDIFVLVERFNNQRGQLDIAMRSDTIAATRYDTNVKTYMVGKMSTLELNDSRVKKDAARREVITELYNYWYWYYQLRSLTLWDFARDIPLDAEDVIPPKM